jgi:HEAT repeat protein
MDDRILPWLWPLLGLAALTVGVGAASPEVERSTDEKMLKTAGVGVDGPALLTFFRQRTLTDTDRARLAEAARLLGDDDFSVREKASADLKAAGRAVLPLLQKAVKSSDAEVVFRARRCLVNIERGSELSQQMSAARLISVLKPAGGSKVLLNFLPMADDEYLRQAIHQSLATLCLRDSKPDEPIVAAAKDKEPTRRVAAAYVLARAGIDQRAVVERLLADPDPRVRLEAASGLVKAGEKSAVPALAALLGQAPADVAWQAEELLRRISRETGPTVVLATGGDDQRRRCRAAWEAWWKKHADQADLAKLSADEGPLGLTLICDCDVDNQPRVGRVWECGPDGKPRWKIDGVKNPADIQVLPGGRVLIAECQGLVVTERDREGKVLWTRRVDNYPVSCQRLPNGNTFIASYSELLEVTRDGETVYSHKKKGNIYCARKRRNGNILYAHGDGAIVELDSSGKEVHSITVEGLSSWAGVEVLPNGRYLISKYSDNRVVEIDKTGKVHWECVVQTPAWCTRLHNGNTLVASTDDHCILELDRCGKEVWKQETKGRPFRVRRH